MANRVSVSIELGGLVTPKDYADLVAIIASEGLSTEWDGPAFGPEDRTEGERLRLYAHEVAGGTFETLEAWCVTNGLAFARWSGGYDCEWNPERVVFTGTGALQYFVADESDRILIDRADIERLGSLEAIFAHFDKADFIVPPLVVATRADA